MFNLPDAVEASWHLAVEARDQGQPAGQLAAGELEPHRLRNTLHRATEPNDDVALALDTAG